MEIWKEINGYDGRYSVSNMGNVKTKGKFLKEFKNAPESLIKPHNNGFDYLQIRITKSGKTKTYRLHRLVAEYFIPNENLFKTEVNHIDGNKFNNCVANLEWVTPQENAIHSVKNRLSTKRKLKMEDAEKIRELNREGYSYGQISDIYKCNKEHIYKIIKNKKWTVEKSIAS